MNEFMAITFISVILLQMVIFFFLYMIHSEMKDFFTEIYLKKSMNLEHPMP